MMQAVVLTPQEGLGELLRESLASVGLEVVVLADLPAGESAAAAAPALLVLDGDMAPPARLAACVGAFRQHNPRLRVVLLAPESAGAAAQAAVAPDLTLARPFYLPDFLAALEDWLGEASPWPENAAGRTLPPRPPWLRDVAVAAQHLARLSLETAAQAAALATTGGRLWAYAGELPQPAAEELARLTAHYWETGGGADFVRFLRLEAVQQDYLLYATGVTADLVLAMLFDVQVPFSRIRAQAGHLAEALTRNRPPEEDALPAPPGPPAEAAAPAAPPAEAPPLPEDALPLPPPLPASGEPALSQAAAPPEPPADALPPEAFEPLFDRVPPPEPPTPEAASPETQAVKVAEAVSPEEASLSGLQPSAAPAAATALPPSPQPVHAAVFYACVLAPRFPQHHLTGDLARDLSQWLPQIATALGWRLVHLAVRPEYLQWVAQTPPETSPAAVLRAVREQTSRRIFAAYPRLAEINIGGDFWAPGYLLLSQNRPVAAETIAAFIAAARRHQGLTP